MDAVSATHPGRLSRLPVAVLMVAIALAALAPLSARAGEPAPFPLPITKFNCETDPGVIPQAVIPDGCVTVPGVAMTVTDSEDNVLGSCITDADGDCIVNVDIPDDATVFVEEDVSTGTAGYTPRENPVEVEIVNEFSEAKLVNIKDVSDLPDTGAGPIASDTRDAAIPLAVIAGLLALAATLTLSLGTRFGSKAT
jgi:hypothetical protein